MSGSRRIAGWVVAVLITATTLTGADVVALAGRGSGTGAPGWTHDGYGPGNTSYDPYETRITASTVGGLRQRWTVETPGTGDWCNRQLPPLAGGGRVFLPDPDGVGAYGAATGERHWHWEFPRRDGEGFGVMAVAGSLVLVLTRPCGAAGESFSFLTALATQTGAVRWRNRLGRTHGILVVDQGVAVVGGDAADAVTAFRAADGAHLWRRTTSYLHSPVSNRGRLLLNRVGGGVHAVAVTTGRTLWNRSRDWFPVSASPAGDQLIMWNGGRLVAVDAASGARRWSIRHSGRLAHDGRRIYLAYKRSIETYDAATGRKVRITHLPGRAGQPVRAGGLLYATAGAEPMLILDPDTGRRVATHVAGPVVADHPVVTGGWLYTTDGEVLRAYAP
jgi:outer membrane protein assembly factor BamB